MSGATGPAAGSDPVRDGTQTVAERVEAVLTAVAVEGGIAPQTIDRYEFKVDPRTGQLTATTLRAPEGRFLRFIDPERRARAGGTTTQTRWRRPGELDDPITDDDL